MLRKSLLALAAIAGLTGIGAAAAQAAPGPIPATAPAMHNASVQQVDWRYDHWREQRRHEEWVRHREWERHHHHYWHDGRYYY